MITYQEKIAELVFDYAKHAKPIDNNYLSKLIYIMTSEYDVSKYLNKVLCRKYGKYKMAYNPVFKKLKINTEKMKHVSIPYCIFYSKEKDYFLYRDFNESLFHEFSHMKQFKQNTIFNDADIESKLIYLSNKLWNILMEYNGSLYLHLVKLKMRDLMPYITIYEKYYNLDVTERLAKLESYQISGSIARILGLKNTADYERLNEYNLYTKSLPNTSPTLEYLDKLYKSEEIAKIRVEIANKNLSLEERLRLGLQINEEEYEKLIYEEQQLQRKLDIKWITNL